MSSDYIPRLRAELLRAGARRQTSRWRPVRVPMRPLIPVAAAALIVAALVVAWPTGRENETAAPQTPTTEFAYRTDPAGADEVARILGARLATAGVDAEVSVSGGRLTITAPEAARADVAALTQRGVFSIYDWETSVLGPSGRPAPSDPSVTGGADAGRSSAVSKAEAQARGDRAGSGRLVRADGGAPDQWFALGGDPWMANACVDRARPGTDRTSGEPTVTIDLNAEGRQVFAELTRQLAQRGADRQGNQHLALVIDDRIVSVPYIDYRQAPDGLSGADGIQIAGGLTKATARTTAAILSSGPLPAAVTRASS
jgi:preprotein translocase subunit SecD